MTSLAHARQENAHLKQKLEALQLRASRTATAESRAAEANEPILQPNTERKCIFPIKHKEVWKMVRRPNPRTAVQTLGLRRRWSSAMLAALRCHLTAGRALRPRPRLPVPPV